MADAYLMFEAGTFRLLLPAAEVRQSLAQAPTAWYDLSVALGGVAATAWIACSNDMNLGVSGILGLIHVPPEDLAALPAADLVDAVTLAPLRGAHAWRLTRAL